MPNKYIYRESTGKYRIAIVFDNDTAEWVPSALQFDTYEEAKKKLQFEGYFQDSKTMLFRKVAQK